MIRIVRFGADDVFSAAADAMIEGRAKEGDWAALTVFCERYGTDVVAETLARRCGSDGPGERWWRCNLRLLVPRTLAETVDLCGELAILAATGRGPKFDDRRHALQLSGALYQLQSYQARLGSEQISRAERCAAIMVVHCVPVARCTRA
jgi:hypothetical protein